MIFSDVLVNVCVRFDIINQIIWQVIIMFESIFSLEKLGHSPSISK